MDISGMLMVAVTALVISPFLLGGVTKARDFSAAVAEVRELRVPAPTVTAGAVIALQLAAPILILVGLWVWIAALLLALFTLAATLMAHSAWLRHGADLPRDRMTFFEHMAIVGGLGLIALSDLGMVRVTT